MAFNITSFRSNMTGDGARPNLFNVQIALPTGAVVPDGSAAAQKLSFMVKSSQLPGSTLGTVPLYYFGRELKFAGNRTFTDWTVQIINDEDMLIRRAIEEWMGGINSHVTNLRNLGTAPSSYTFDGMVTQYSKAGLPLKTYKMVGMFPVDLAPIDLDWGSNDSIEEYSVTFAYQYWSSDTTQDDQVGPQAIGGSN
jgi:hypothetical protein